MISRQKGDAGRLVCKNCDFYNRRGRKKGGAGNLQKQVMLKMLLVLVLKVQMKSQAMYV